MLHRKSEGGQALILIVFGIVALIGLTGLAIDGGNTYANRQQAQTSADSAAMAAALQMAKSTGNWNSAAVNTAALNGNVEGDNTTVEAHLLSQNPTDCNGNVVQVPADLPDQDSSHYVLVVIKTDVQAYFAPVVGVDQTHNCVEALARGKPIDATSTAMFGGAGIVATDPHGQHAFHLNGGAQVATQNSGIFVNSDDSQAVMLENGSHLDMDQPGQIVGNYGVNGGAHWSPGFTTSVDQISMPLPEWNSVPAIPATPTCSGPNHGDINSSGTYPPGIYGNINGGDIVFTPGVYCISGYNSGNLSQAASPSGTVKLVMNGNLSTDGNITFDDLEIYTTGTLQAHPSARLDISRFRFYNSGGGAFIIDSGARMVSADAFIYLNSGNLVLNSGGKVDLQAPTGSDPYAGLLVYMPWDTNTNTVILNSGSGFDLTGTVLAPHANFTCNSGSNADALDGQIIGWDFIFNSGNKFSVTYNAAHNYNPPSLGDASVQLIK